MHLGLGLGLTSLRGASGGGGGSQPLRFASNENIAATSFRTMSGTRLHRASRRRFVIGAGDRSDLVPSFKNWIMELSGVTPNTNGFTIEEAAVEIGASYVPVTFGGSPSRFVTAGETDVKGDAIAPSEFSLTEFAVGTECWLRVHDSVTTAGHQLLEGVNYEGARQGVYPDWVGWAFDPAENPNVDPIYGVGQIDPNGAADGCRAASAVILGRFVSGDPATWLGIGDSIMWGSDDSMEGEGFGGFFARALTNATFDGSWGAGMNFGVSGAGPNLWTEGANLELAMAYWQYAKCAVDEFGTNPFYFGAPLASVQADSQALWALLRGEGIEDIIHPHILPRTDSTDSWATTANQTPVNSAFQAGGNADLFNTWLSTRIGPTGISSVLALNSVRAASSGAGRWQWAVNGTPNYMCDLIGTHPTGVGHALIATDLRTEMASYP